MFAVIETGGKQYKVSQNDVLKIEKVAGDVGSTVIFDKVLIVNDGKKSTIGAPYVAKVKVAAEVLEQKKDKKVIIFKKRRRQNSRRKNGHRQQISVVRIGDIGENVKAAPAKAAPKKVDAKPAAEKKTAPIKETAAKPAAKKTSTAAKKPAAKKDDK